MKVCPQCGNQGRCTDSRKTEEFTRRRYLCACGHKWTTGEFLIHESQTKVRNAVETFRRREAGKLGAELGDIVRAALNKATRV